MTTNAAFIAAMQAMTVTGVSKHYDEPPASVDLSGGVAAFPSMPDGTAGNYFSSCANQRKTRAMDYVLILEAAGQGTQASKYAQFGPLMDNLETALDALNFIVVNYEITTTMNYPIGGSDYSAIIARVTIADATLL